MTVSLEKTTRPLIRFDDADVDRSTARRYAADIISRVNKPKTNEVMEAVAYDLAEACTDAMRHVATRFGQSMVRRREGEKVAHLAYIAHAVLANHADGLPVYEPGARSRRVEELSLEVEHAGVVNQTLTADLTKERNARREAERQYLDAQRRAETAEGALAALKAAANDEVTRLGMAVNSNLEAALQSMAERDEVAQVLLYALEHLDAEKRQRVFGFWDAVSAS
jgi:hypothetical protein